MHKSEVRPLVAETPGANITDLLLERVAQTPNASLFSRYIDGDWANVRACDFLEEVKALAKGLISAGIQPGDKIGLLSRTRYEWTLIDFAVWWSGACIVPIYETSSPYQVRWNLRNSQACALIVETRNHRIAFDSLKNEIPGVSQVWQIEGGDLESLKRAGERISDVALERRRSRANEADIATIIYTSGTSGDPKGCVLTHGNFVELCRNTLAAIPEVFAPGGSTALFMPMAHVFARFIAVLAVHGGVKVAHEPDLSRLLLTLNSFQPSFLLAVPRIFEKVYNSSEQKAEAAGKGGVFRKAAETAIAYSKAIDAGRIPLRLRIGFAVYDRLVLHKIRAALGSNLRYAVSGSAPLGERLGHFYRGLGLTILEGYGLTETTAPVSVNRPGSFSIGSVGAALPGVSVRIAEDGEIQIRGVSQFREYWDDPDATAAAFSDGWFRTGDIGCLDAAGYLTITGRKKELIVTAGGKNVAPAVLEDPIRANPIISQVVVVGDQRPFISALVTLDRDMLTPWLKSKDLDSTISLVEAARHPAVTEEVQRAIDGGNLRVSRAESIRKFLILPMDFTEAAGQLTPKLSVKRAMVLSQFETEIDQIYTNRTPPQAV
ncbi:long-chain fatty acid--CoA ligase [Arthrobacter sp. SLBN-112]|uniref:AMP-dependent synthetase/ligase n=1 Tax=Arthrobacter sp. SLBN-112 TaxID=2768452 RepID=UPI0027AE935D|nr:long-chain fatty acid--CoA ligase [Arthrobacter sp. SLBN-112]MDQ0801444.1 long-chain acyl-CoA synthetase [Arthrobacter sp. SLBN-112]